MSMFRRVMCARAALLPAVPSVLAGISAWHAPAGFLPARPARSAGWLAGLVLVPAPVLAPVLAHAQTAVLKPFAAGDIEGVLARPPLTQAPGPAVILLHDETGPDGREDAYAEALTRLGFVVLDLRSHPAHAVAAARAVRSLALNRMVDPGRIALLGFGAGGLAVLSAGEAVAARVLLYPGCRAMAEDAARAPLAGPLLLLYGDNDPANQPADCARAATRLRARGATVVRVEYADAGFAWDYPLHGAERRVLLPWPGSLAASPPAHGPRWPSWPPPMSPNSSPPC